MYAPGHHRRTPSAKLMGEYTPKNEVGEGQHKFVLLLFPLCQTKMADIVKLDRHGGAE